MNDILNLESACLANKMNATTNMNCSPQNQSGKSRDRFTKLLLRLSVFQI